MNSLVVTSFSPQDLKTKMKHLMKNCSINSLEAKTELIFVLDLVTGTLNHCNNNANEIVIKSGPKNFCIFN